MLHPRSLGGVSSLAAKRGPMANNTFVEIDIPEAEALADYTGIASDLRTAGEFAQMILDERAKKQPNWSLSDPLTTAAIVRYARPFMSGVRRRLDCAALEVLTPAQRSMHDRLCAIRNKHIAHSVNAFEDSQPVARYWEERVREEGIESISCQHRRVIGLSGDELNGILELTAAMLVYVEARLAEERAKVLEAVRRMPLGEILARPKPPLAQFQNSDPSKRRR
jgi:hypothetical protein